MDTEILTLTVDRSLAEELGAASQELLIELLRRGLRDLKIERALDHYAAEALSFGAAAREAGVSQAELARYAYARGMEPPYDEQMIREELGK